MTTAINSSSIQTTPRIGYIDLLKGICITLVVLFHCHVPIASLKVTYMLENLRMPLYFFLSGLFFKEYGGFCDFSIRKIDKLVIPYLFFAIIFVIPDLFLLNPDEISRIATADYWKELLLLPRNRNLWFLRSLFFANIFFFIFHKATLRLHVLVQLLIAVALAWIVNNATRHLQIPAQTDLCLYWLMNTATAVTVIPLFIIAHFARSKNLLQLHLSPLVSAALLIFFLALWYFATDSIVALNINAVGRSIIRFYIAALSAIACAWIIARFINYIPLISYIGRYSLIVLGTHIVFIEYGQNIGLNPWILAAITIVAMPPIIWVLKTIIPWATAQRPLLQNLYRQRVRL